MNVFLRADSVTLELPLDIQRVDEGGRSGGFKATMGGSSRTYRDVLKNISFTAEEGDRIGVLGLNGAGKTTLLRVLNGAFPPTLGRVERRGSVQSLLNATLGFSEYASVTENVILRGTAMGLRRRQLEGALPEILEFAGLSDKAAHRLHTLSSGQRMRLGFAISTAIQPDILLMDEWIATGDAAFIKRAQDRLLNRFRDSRIVVLASHSTRLLNEMCNKAIVLDEGRMSFFGGIAEGIEVYREIALQANDSARRELANSDPMLFGDSVGLIERVTVADETVTVEGWVIDDRGGEVSVIKAELDGHDEVFERFDRIDREDVRHHLGKRSGRYGFKIEIKPGAIRQKDLVVKRLVISGGARADRMGPPLAPAKAAVVRVV